VREAVPLSRFLLDAAADECDLSTAEGRSHFAANARPLWQAMPQGLLKQQLLADIAARAGVESAALLASWGGERAPERERQRAESMPPPGQRAAAPYPGVPRRALRPLLRPVSEAQARNAARLLLRDTGLWGNALTEADRDLLGRQPGTYGELFRWLDRQYTEHGPQPLSALLAAAQDQSCAPLLAELRAAEHLAAQHANADDAESALDPPEDLPRQLRRCLLALHLAACGNDIDRLSSEVEADPADATKKADWQAAIQKQIAIKRALLAVAQP
jgi:DNA primase